MNQRYALYYSPRADTTLGHLAARWLGRECHRLETIEQTVLPGFSSSALWRMTTAPRHYGFHATLKPPFFLAAGRHEQDLMLAVEALASTQPPVTLGSLEVTSMRGFLALTPQSEDTSEINALARACVQQIDNFRRPADEAELARRRAAGLSTRQEQLLKQWGYPYVMDEFQFHLTLTEKLAHDCERELLHAALNSYFETALQQSHVIDTLTLMAQQSPERAFVEIARYPLVLATQGRI